VNRHHYLRVLALACIDILLTLPLGVITVTTQLLSQIRNPALGFSFRFYYGWSFVHSNWGPAAYPYSSLVGSGFWNSFEVYFEFWAPPILAIAIFGLFGLTSEACATYWHFFCTVANLFGWKPPAPKDEDLGEIEFGARQFNTTEQYVAQLLAADFLAYQFCLRSHPSFFLPVVGGSDVEDGYECILDIVSNCVC
jgi:hypothetical protein